MKPPSLSKYARQETRICLGHFKTNLRHAAKHPGDPSAIHDLRVSIRRLTQCFRVFYAPAKKLRRRLHKMMEHCGAVRNRDIALELLVECGFPASPSALKLKKEREDAAQKLHRNLKKERHRRYRAVDTFPPPRHGLQIASLLPALAEDFFETGDASAAPDSSYQNLHRFRLRAKRFRYTLELFQRVYESEVATAAKSLKGVQDRLGAINDCVTTIGLLENDPTAVAAIQQRLDQRIRAFQTYWRSHFPQTNRARWNRWLKKPRAAARERLKATSTASSGTAAHPG